MINSVQSLSLLSAWWGAAPERNWDCSNRGCCWRGASPEQPHCPQGHSGASAPGEMAFDSISGGFPALALSQSEISGGREGGCNGRNVFKAELLELISSPAPWGPLCYLKLWP